MNKSSKGGCVRRGFGGCLSLFFVFAVLLTLLSSIEFPEFDFSIGKTTKSSYLIEMDSLSNERMIASSFTWKFVGSNLSKKRVSLSFSLLEKEVENALQMIDRIGRMSTRELGLDPSVNYADPDEQTQIIWARIYNLVYTGSLPQLKSISDGFNNVFKTESMSDKDKLLFVVSFVQNIKYERPGGALDLMAPLATIAKQFGDCDTKAILLYVLLERMGIDCAMLWSQHYKHAMLGINTSTRGDYKKYNGKKYYFLETTYPGWDIGTLPPEFKNKRFWYVSEIEHNATRNKFKINNQREGEKSNKRNKPSPVKR